MSKFSLDIEKNDEGFFIITSSQYPGLLLSGRELSPLLSDVELVITKLMELDKKCPYCRTEIESTETYLEDHDECFPC